MVFGVYIIVLVVFGDSYPGIITWTKAVLSYAVKAFTVPGNILFDTVIAGKPLARIGVMEEFGIRMFCWTAVLLLEYALAKSFLDLLHSGWSRLFRKKPGA